MRFERIRITIGSSARDEANPEGGRRRRRHRLAIGAGLLAGVSVAAAACGGSAQTADAGSSSSARQAAEQAAVRLGEWYRGTDRSLPTSAPAPQAGKNVWVISCAQATEGCAVPSKGIKEAGEKVGWRVTVVDGQFNPSVQSNGIRDAVSNKADAIVAVATDCPNVQAALEVAKAARIPVYSDFSVDCDEANGGPRLFSGFAVADPHGRAPGAYAKTVHVPVVIDWVTSKTKGAGHVLVVDQPDQPVLQMQAAGYKEQFPKTCPQCVVTHLAFTGQDVISGNLKSLVAAALVKDPKITVVVAPYDASIPGGIGAAVQQQSGRKILVTGYEGLSANIDQIKGGGPANLATGFPSRWAGWSTVDALNRMFNNSPQVDEGMGYQAIDHEHNLPTLSPYYDGNVDAQGKPKQDYEANFLRIWGVS